MKLIRQYWLDPGWGEVSMPADAECLSVGLVDNRIVIWAMHKMPKLNDQGEFEAPFLKNRIFSCVLNDSLFRDEPGRYLGTVRVPQRDGITTYHVFEVSR